jgi:hypothetical protein
MRRFLVLTVSCTKLLRCRLTYCVQSFRRTAGCVCRGGQGRQATMAGDYQIPLDDVQRPWHTSTVQEALGTGLRGSGRGQTREGRPTASSMHRKNFNIWRSFTAVFFIRPTTFRIGKQKVVFLVERNIGQQMCLLHANEFSVYLPSLSSKRLSCVRSGVSPWS